MRNVLADVKQGSGDVEQRIEAFGEAGKDAWEAARDDLEEAFRRRASAYQDARESLENAGAPEDGVNENGKKPERPPPPSVASSRRLRPRERRGRAASPANGRGAALPPMGGL